MATRRKTFGPWTAPLLFCALAAACNDNLEKQSRVSKLRVLAVRADPPELVLDPAGPPPSTVLTALAVEPSDAGIALKFALCAALGAPSATLDCPGDAGVDLPDAGQHAARLSLDDPRLLALAASLSTPFDGGMADAGAALAAGVPLLVGFDASSTGADGGAERLSGFDTVTLRTGAPSGANPELRGLQLAEELDGGSLGPAADISPGVTARAGATYHLIPLPGPKDDPARRYGFSFFSTAGTISALRSTDVTATGQAADTWIEWTAPRAPGPVRFWVVLRDGRGTAWVERDLDVR